MLNPYIWDKTARFTPAGRRAFLNGERVEEFRDINQHREIYSEHRDKKAAVSDPLIPTQLFYNDLKTFLEQGKESPGEVESEKRTFIDAPLYSAKKNSRKYHPDCTNPHKAVLQGG